MTRAQWAIGVVLLVATAAGAQVQRPPNYRTPEADPKAAQARAMLKEGQKLLADDDFEAAAKAFEESIALDPLLMMAHYGLGTARMARKEYAAAVAAFEGARRAFHEGLAQTDELRQQSQATRQERMRQLRDILGRMEEPTSRGGRAVAQRQEWEAELAMLEAAEDSGGVPKVPAGLSLSLGSAHFRTGRLADAEREYRAALDANPRLGEARVNLAVVLLMTGRPAEAKEEIRLAKKAKAKVPAGLEKDVDAALAGSR